MGKVERIWVHMFNKAAKAFNQPIGDWDVSQVTDMESIMFCNGATSFNQPIGDWDVSNVTDMYSMFSGSSFNQAYRSSWDVSQRD